MKRIALVLAVCVALSPVCLAESESSTDRFLSGLSETWDAFLDMAGDAGNSAVQWAEESGVAEWVDGAASDISAWAEENGLTDWATDTLNTLSVWFDETGITEWASDTSGKIQAFVEENRPVIEAWLAQAGQEVRDAWDTLMHAEQHTGAEVEEAYGIVEASLEEAAQ